MDYHLHLTIVAASGSTVMERECKGFRGLALNQYGDDGTALIFDAKYWEDGASVFIESDEVWMARKRREERLRTSAPDLLSALRSARARLALVLGADRDPRDDATVREIDAAIAKATGE